MRSLLLLTVVAAVSYGFVVPFDQLIVEPAVPFSKSALLGGALCKPCIDLITNGENGITGDFNTWFDKEVKWLCAPLGPVKNDCVKYFEQYEQEFDHFITSCADPTESCQTIDFCSKTSLLKSILKF